MKRVWRVQVDSQATMKAHYFPLTTSGIHLELVAKLTLQYCWLECGEGNVGKPNLRFRNCHVGLVGTEGDE